MVASLFLSLRAGVSLVPGGAGELVLHSAHARLALQPLAPGTLAALERLGTTGEYEDRLTEIVCQTDGAAALPTFYYYLQRFVQGGFLLTSARLNGERLATLTPTSRFGVLAARNISPDRRYVLSRFAYTRREKEELVLESPLSHARVTLQDWRATALVHALAQPRRAEDLGARLPDLPATAARELLTLLLNADMLAELHEDGSPAEEENAPLQSWEFHDLLFHTRSREGRHDSRVGGTYRFVGRLDPPPALRPAASTEVVELFRPDLERLQREDRPFALIQETRRSIREYDMKPITDRQLGEFLYRVARVKECWVGQVETPHGPIPMAFAPRPYPGGGALYELELYVAVSACDALAPGLYRYEPNLHRLERLSGRTADLDRLLLDATEATGLAREELQVLLIIAARFPRIAWKYASMAYALILKHSGVLYQTMYLAATAMDLAPCGVGCGNADVFARAAGTDYYAETSVGEFLLGSKRPDTGIVSDTG